MWLLALIYFASEALICLIYAIVVASAKKMEVFSIYERKRERTF